MPLVSEYIRRLAVAAGFSSCGIARAEPLVEHAAPLDKWLDEGMDGGLEYMRRAPQKRLDPEALLIGARTIVVCAVNYKNAAWNQTESPRIASYAYARDYHATIKGMLGNMLKQLTQLRGRAFCDTAPILEKAWAVRAGVGRTGKNTLLITPGHGSFVLLGVLILDAECDTYDTPIPGDVCGSCTRCMDICPNGALVAPHTLDARRCISRLTLEKNPPEGDTHGWLAGCDLCQSCCPHNHNTPLSIDPRWAPVIPAPAPPAFWHTLTAGKFDALLAETPLSRSSYFGALR